VSEFHGVSYNPFALTWSIRWPVSDL